MRDCLTFMLNGEVLQLRGIDPAATLLTWLRRERRLTGTKEGCAEGDCGACTVTVGELDAAGGIRYRALNACILLMGMLEGRSVTTVEHLRSRDGGLHPVQQAMVEAHGSQCGFCTPGIVMSLYATYQGEPSGGGRHIDDMLAGNLCRCTGYGPIVEAAQAIRARARTADAAVRSEAEQARLRGIAHDETAVLTAAGSRFYSPATLDELVRLAGAHPDAVILSGATDVGLWITKQRRRIDTFIHTGRVRELGAIAQVDGMLRLGAGVRWADAEAELGRRYPDLGELLRRFGSLQVRNGATVGGNIANGSPIGDGAPALMALGARLVLRKGAARRTLPLEAFFVAYGQQDRQPGELVEAVEVPLDTPPEQLKCYKITKRFDQDISAVCGCFNVDASGGTVQAARIAFGGMAGTPMRATNVEAALTGRPWTLATVMAALPAFERDYAPISDLRGSAAYRLQVARNLLLKYFHETQHPLRETRLVGRGTAAGAHRAGLGQQDDGGAAAPAGTEAARASGVGASAAAIDGGVGTARRHDSSTKHVSGEAVYIDDIPTPPGTLHVYIAMSERAHAAVTRLDVSEVRTAPGVAMVLTARDVPGVNDVSPFAGDDPMFADGVVQHWGQSLFAVAADTIEQARAAAKLAVVTYVDRPAVLTIEDALAVGSLLEPPYTIARGDAAAAIAAAPHSLEGRIRIGGQEHFYLEGQAALAMPGEDEDVTVYCSTQHPSEIQHKVAHVLGVPSHAVTVETRRMGGGFGGKESQGNLPAAVAALAAKLTGRPAKCVYDRDDDFMITGKRHDFRIDYRVGFDGEGRILGLEVEQAVRCGMSTDLSPAIADRAMLHADNAYHLPAVRITSYRCKTNTQSNTAFRGFGGPQGMLGMERIIDEIAHALGHDPLAVRQVNFYDHKDAPAAGRVARTEKVAPRNLTPYHQTVEDCVIQELIDELEVSSDYRRRRAEIRHWNAGSRFLKRGIALTPVKFGISFTNTMMNQAGALVHIYADGSIALNHGGTEMGQGLNIKVAQVVAEELQVDIDRIKITATTTAKVPNTSPTAASSGSDLNGMAARNAAATIKGRLAQFLAERHQAGVNEVTFLPGRIRIRDHEIAFDEAIGEAYRARVHLSAAGFYATPKIEWDRPSGKGRPFFYFAYGAAVSEVVIDTLTGENRILRTDILHDVGRSLNPAIDRGQIEGGFVQGAGWLTTEELVWDAQGRLLTHAPSTYKIPACSDRPVDMRVRIWDKGRNVEETIYRSKAVGEPPLMLAISVLLALSDAVASVGDYRVYPALDAPATPERVLMAVERIKREAAKAGPDR